MKTNTFHITRLGTIMKSSPGDPMEAGGVLNPGGTRGPNGEYYLFPRIVEAPNYSRIGVARVIFDDGRPAGVERLGYALEPDAAFERNPRTAGCEDARVTYVSEIGRYVMVYSSYGPRGPRVAFALSEDCLGWRRIGPALFAYEEEWRADFNLFANKDAFFFPDPVPDPDGVPSLALIHRPDFDVGDGESFLTLPKGIVETRPGMWISYAPLEAVSKDSSNLVHLCKHRPLAFPEYPWEELKIGGGTPPVRTPLGWLMVYHGVTGRLVRNLDHQPEVRYCAGVMVLDTEDPLNVVYRSEQPILEPENEAENAGVVNDVVFPTALDSRAQSHIDVYYGMADARIGAARIDLPDTLPKNSRI
ncbi:MAG: glycoside hydrolase family 130 protein [Rubrobacteraceae bacterium]